MYAPRHNVRDVVYDDLQHEARVVAATHEEGEGEVGAVPRVQHEGGGAPTTGGGPPRTVPQAHGRVRDPLHAMGGA
jgi:hypothetical protein